MEAPPESSACNTAPSAAAAPPAATASIPDRRADPQYLAPFNPTPVECVEEAVRRLQLCERDVVYDLGCGDGRFMERALLAGAGRCVGVEYDAAVMRRAEARVAALPEELRRRVSLRLGAVQDVDFSADATVVFVYLLPKGLAAIAGGLERVRSRGGRVVSHTFAVPGWPDARDVCVHKGVVKTYFYGGPPEGE